MSTVTNRSQQDAWGSMPSPTNMAAPSAFYNEKKPVIGGKSWKEWAMENQDGLVQLGALFAFVMFIYMFFSDGDFSFLLTMSSILSLASFCKVAWVIMNNQSVSGVSCSMIECYIFAFFSRLASILVMDGYLPFDRSGDVIYRLTEIGCAAVSVYIVFLIRGKFSSTYTESDDNLKCYYLIAPCVVLGLLFHPHLNGFMLCDVAWSQGLYLEAVACIPQLVLFRKQRKVEAFTTNFLMTQILVRIFSFIFWASSSRDLHSYHLEGSIRAYASQVVVIMQLLQLLVMGDFIYQYIQCWRRGVPLQFIINDVV